MFLSHGPGTLFTEALEKYCSENYISSLFLRVLKPHDGNLIVQNKRAQNKTAHSFEPYVGLNQYQL